MNERNYKGYTLGQYYKNGRKTKFWYADLDGKEQAADYSTLWSIKHRVDDLIYNQRVSANA